MATEVVELPVVPPTTARLRCEIRDPNGVDPKEVIQHGDRFVVHMEFDLGGVLWDLSSVDFEAKVAIESIGAGLEGSTSPAELVTHNGTPGNAPYHYELNVPVGPLPVVAGETSTAYEIVGTLLATKNGVPTGIGGFCELGKVQVIRVP